VKRLLRLLRCVACLLAGCTGGTETGNPSFEGSLGFDAYTSAPSVIALPSALTQSAQTATQIESTWLVLGDVGFVPQEHCAADAAAQHAQGIGAGDHVGSQAPPEAFELASGRYCGVSLAMLLSERAPTNGPGELVGHSMLIAGTLSDGRAFELLSALRAELFLRSGDAAGFELDAQSSAVLLGFDVAAWLDALPLDSAQVDDDGTVIIDASHNSDVLGSFERQVASGITLFRDLDRDGMLDANPQPLAHGK
jgi:hypothetical protein